MSTRDLARILVFLLGLWLVPGALSGILTLPLYAESLGTVSGDLGTSPDRSFFYASAALAFCNLVFVASFVAAPSWWAGLVFSGRRDVELPRLSEQAVHSLLFSLVGLVLLVFAVTDTPKVAVAWYMQPEATIPEHRRQQFLQHFPERAKLVAQFAIGIWLLFGANGIVRFVRRWRTVGHRKEAA